MNLVSEAPVAIVALLLLLLFSGALEDAVRMRISNGIPVAILILWAPALLLSQPTASVWENAVVFGFLLGTGTMLFATGKFGGGDVKFLSTMGLWCGFADAVRLLVFVFIAGGILAIVVIAARSMVTERQHVAMLKRGSGIPFGVAIGIGAIVTVATTRFA